MHGFLCFSLNFGCRYLGYPVCVRLDVAYFYKYPNVCREEVKYDKVCVDYALASRVLHWPVHRTEAKTYCTQ